MGLTPTWQGIYAPNKAYAAGSLVTVPNTVQPPQPADTVYSTFIVQVDTSAVQNSSVRALFQFGAVVPFATSGGPGLQGTPGISARIRGPWTPGPYVTKYPQGNQYDYNQGPDAINIQHEINNLGFLPGDIISWVPVVLLSGGDGVHDPVYGHPPGYGAFSELWFVADNSYTPTGLGNNQVLQPPPPAFFNPAVPNPSGDGGYTRAFYGTASQWHWVLLSDAPQGPVGGDGKQGLTGEEGPYGTQGPEANDGLDGGDIPGPPGQPGRAGKDGTNAAPMMLSVIPEGAIDGFNKSYTLEGFGGNLGVYLRGLRRQPDTDYTLQEGGFTLNFPANAGDQLLCDYTRASGGA